MFSLFWSGIQQDVKLALVAPVLCAVFRLAFILVYRPKKTPFGEWKKWYHCFRYGFWWGMDFHAYVYLFSLVLVTLPGTFIPAYYAVGDTVRLVGICCYAAVLYTAFMGRMVFYRHFHDVYNHLLFLGRHADQDNLRDIFFHQDHGTWILWSYIPFLAACIGAASWLLGLPTVSFPVPESAALRYALHATVGIAAIALFYWARYGGTFRHRKKPEWDEVPAVVKADIFMGKAVRDDLLVLEHLFHQKRDASLSHSDAEAISIMEPILPRAFSKSPLDAFCHVAAGARIRPPRHIFLLFLESHSQSLLDPLYGSLRLMEASKKWRREANAVSFANFLPGGMVSQPSIVSLMSGVFDCDMELNENPSFWQGAPQTALAPQLQRLGYRTSFWYGGSLTWSSLDHFVPAMGFDRAFGGPDICGEHAPRTWLGVYDHIFLEEVARRIEADTGAAGEFHFVYTTSNHGPYRIPFEQYGFDAETVMPDAPAALKRDAATRRSLASAWYADQSAVRFIERMREMDPDSLFIVTGDHATDILPLAYDIVPRREMNLREHLLTSFAMAHPSLDPAMLAERTIGSHMHIAPTLFEMIAPSGFPYRAIVPSFFEPIDHVVTPYAWMTKDAIGSYVDETEQPLAVSARLLSVRQEVRRFDAEQKALCELSGWLVRHPECLV